MTSEPRRWAASEAATLTKLERDYIARRHADEVLNPCPPLKVSTPYRETNEQAGAHLWSLGYHTGEDYPAPAGTPVYAVTWGHVVGVGWAGGLLGWGADYGLMVIIRTASGEHDYGYAHLSTLDVRQGAKVCPGILLGRTGATGHVTGAHLHFEARPAGGRFGSDVRPLLVKQRQH